MSLSLSSTIKTVRHQKKSNHFQKKTFFLLNPTKLPFNYSNISPHPFYSASLDHPEFQTTHENTAVEKKLLQIKSNLKIPSEPAAFIGCCSPQEDVGDEAEQLIAQYLKQSFV